MRTLLPLFLLVGCHPHASVSHPPAASHEHGHGHRAHEMPHRFEDAEAWAKRFDDPSRDAWQKPDAVIANLALPPGATVADVGAGTGYFAVRLARAVPQGKVFASDIEPDMVRYLGERAGRDGDGGAGECAVIGGGDGEGAAGRADDARLDVDRRDLHPVAARAEERERQRHGQGDGAGERERDAVGGEHR